MSLAFLASVTERKPDDVCRPEIGLKIQMPDIEVVMSEDLKFFVILAGDRLRGETTALLPIQSLNSCDSL